VGVQTGGGGDAPDCYLAGANALPPDLMSADERLDELAQILAAGLLRLLQKRKYQNNHNWLEKNSLDLSPGRSGHATARQRREVRR
jgi:hypothetical protein